MSNNILGELLRHHDDNLQHFGIKGMRWGVRRASKATNIGKKSTPAEGSKKIKQIESQLKSVKGLTKRKALEKKHGDIEDSIDYSRPKKSSSNSLANKAKEKVEAIKANVKSGNYSVPRIKKRTIIKAMYTPLSVSAIKAGRKYLK